MARSAKTSTVAKAPVTANVQEEMSRGMSAAQSGDKANAYRIFQLLATQNENDAEVWVWLGGTSPNLDDAEAAFQRAVLLDPSNEEANLGLRWVALRRQVLSAVGASTSDTDTGIFSTGRGERHTSSFNLATGAFDHTVPGATGPLGTGFLTNSANTGTGTLTGPLVASDADALKIKVDGKAGKRRRIPVGAIVLIIIALALYAFAAYMLFVPR